MFLWPPSQLPRVGDWISNTNAVCVEGTLDAYWPNSNPVVFSSARSGLTAILEHLLLKRPDLVWCPAYSSHCVLEAVAHIATPSPLLTPDIKAALIYHQWGFVHQHPWGRTIPIIEDAVDTLFMPGCCLFAAQGRFCLWSLPKVLATLCGGIVFCESEADAIALRRLRDQRGASLFQTNLRVIQKYSGFAAKYWNGAEAMQGGLPSLALSQIDNAVKNITKLVEQRMTVLKSCFPKLAKFVENSGRLPSNLPLTIVESLDAHWGEGRRHAAGYRNFNVNLSCANSRWVPCAPLPLHSGMSSDELLSNCATFKTAGIKDELGFI